MEKEQGHEDADRTGDWSRLLKTRYKKELGEISREYPHKRSLSIDYRDIERFGKAGISLADELLENPGEVLEDVWDAIRNDQLIKDKGREGTAQRGSISGSRTSRKKPVSAISGPMTSTRSSRLKGSCGRPRRSGRGSLKRHSAALQAISR